MDVFQSAMKQSGVMAPLLGAFPRLFPKARPKAVRQVRCAGCRCWVSTSSGKNGLQVGERSQLRRLENRIEKTSEVCSDINLRGRQLVREMFKKTTIPHVQGE